MDFNEQDLVKIVAHPEWSKKVGFIDKVMPDKNLYQVGLLNQDGLDLIVTVSSCYLYLDDREETKQLYNKYQTTLTQIKQEADERQKQMMAVTNHLARKYNLTPNEIYGIYKSVLNYQDYFADYLWTSPTHRPAPFR